MKCTTSPFGEVLWGDGGIDVEREMITRSDGTTEQGAIEQVFVRRRLFEPFYYARSQVCRETTYTWDSSRTALNADEHSLTFCFGRPIDPNGEDNKPYAPGLDSYHVWYPEEALLAFYRNGQVAEIILAASGERRIVDAIVQVKDSSHQITNVNWRLTRQSTGDVGKMTAWELEQLPDP